MNRITKHNNHSTPTRNGSTAALAAAATGLLLILFGGQGCSVTAGESWGTGDRGRILISADAEGMQAFGDLIQGSISNGKASPDIDTPHYQMRREQVRARALKWSSWGTNRTANGSSQSQQPQRPQSGAVHLGREYEGYAQK